MNFLLVISWIEERQQDQAASNRVSISIIRTGTRFAGVVGVNVEQSFQIKDERSSKKVKSFFSFFFSFFKIILVTTTHSLKILPKMKKIFSSFTPYCLNCSFFFCSFAYMNWKSEQAKETPWIIKIWIE